jgi:hypothetical protein
MLVGKTVEQMHKIFDEEFADKMLDYKENKC